MWTLFASALVATTTLTLGQSALGQEDESPREEERDATERHLGIPDLDWLTPDSKSNASKAEAMRRRPEPPWAGMYFSHLKDIVDLTTPGPNGYDTEEWRYYLVLRPGGVAQFTTQIFYDYYPGFGTENQMRYFYAVWGPNHTARWTDRGGQLSITGPFADGLQDTGNPALNYHRRLPRERVSFILRWVGSDYRELQLTGVVTNIPFPSQEGNTWNFYKIAN